MIKGVWEKVSPFKSIELMASFSQNSVYLLFLGTVFFLSSLRVARSNRNSMLKLIDLLESTFN